MLKNIIFIILTILMLKDLAIAFFDVADMIDNNKINKKILIKYLIALAIDICIMYVLSGI